MCMSRVQSILQMDMDKDNFQWLYKLINQSTSIELEFLKNIAALFMTIKRMLQFM